MSWADAIQNHILYVNAGMLVVQILAFIGLVFYVKYTRDLRKAAQDQITISQNLLKAANDQSEGIAKPCMTITGKLRDASKTLLAMDDATGGVCVDDVGGHYVAVNIGNGIAMNVSYFFKHRRDENQPWSKPTGSYLPNVLPNHSQRIQLALMVNAHGGDHQITYLFQSLGGRWYESGVNPKNETAS